MSTDIDKNLQEIGQDVKIIADKVHNIAVDTAVNTASLKEHMRRTEASEKRLEKLEDARLKDKAQSATIITIVISLAEIIRRFL